MQLLSPSREKITLSALIQVPITIVGALLMGRSGKRPLLMVSATGTFPGCFLTGTAFLLEGQAVLFEWVPTLAVSGVLFHMREERPCKVACRVKLNVEAAKNFKEKIRNLSNNYGDPKLEHAEIQ